MLVVGHRSAEEPARAFSSGLSPPPPEEPVGMVPGHRWAEEVLGVVAGACQLARAL